MTPLTIKALEYLTERCNITMLHTSDEDIIKVTLRALHKQGEVLNASAIEQWALKNNWQSTPVKNLSKWAKAIGSGGRVQLKYKNMAPTEKEILSRLK